MLSDTVPLFVCRDCGSLNVGYGLSVQEWENGRVLKDISILWCLECGSKNIAVLEIPQELYEALRDGSVDIESILDVYDFEVDGYVFGDDKVENESQANR